MPSQPTSFSKMRAHLPRLEVTFSPHVLMGDRPDDAFPLQNVDGPTLDGILNGALCDYPKGDAKMAASFLIGAVARAVCEPMCGAALRGGVPDLDLQDTHLSPRLIDWEEDGETGTDQVFDLCLSDDPVLIPCSALALAGVVARLLGPVIGQISSQTRHSQGALWRLVGDALSYCCLEHARRLGDAQPGIDLALGVLRDRQSRLFCRQTRFDFIEVPEAPEKSDWLRVRGGCCRVYTARSEPKSYCTTCVLRDDTSRRDRFRDHLRTR